MSENLQRTCNELATDCISRQGAIDAIADYLSKTTYTSAISYLNTGAMILARVPSAERKGKWINHRNDCGHNIADCSECGSTIQWFDDDEKPKFCCMCGSRNKEEEEDEDIH